MEPPTTTTTTTTTTTEPPTSRQKATIFVGGLDQSTTQEDLYNAFLPFGDIVDVTLSTKPSSTKPSAGTTAKPEQQHRGFGYIEYESAHDAAEAMDNMDRAELRGSVIKVAPAKPVRQAGEGLGSRVAVWEQEGWIARHAVSDEDRRAATAAAGTQQQGLAGKDDGDEDGGGGDGSVDPMQGLEGLDEAGPKQA